MAETYDLRETFSLRALYQDIEPRHGISWRTRKHSLSGFEMTDEKAKEFIDSHRDEDVIIAVIFDFGVTVYLNDGVEIWQWKK